MIIFSKNSKKRNEFKRHFKDLNISIFVKASHELGGGYKITINTAALFDKSRYFYGISAFILVILNLLIQFSLFSFHVKILMFLQKLFLFFFFFSSFPFLSFPFFCKRIFSGKIKENEWLERYSKCAYWYVAGSVDFYRRKVFLLFLKHT